MSNPIEESKEQPKTEDNTAELTNKAAELLDEDSDEDQDKVEYTGIQQADLQYLLSDKNWEKTLVTHSGKDAMISKLVELGYKKPSKIQSKTIPFIMANSKNLLIAQSQNGTGKTLAFVIPSILSVDTNYKLHKQENSKIYFPQVLILENNIELAAQTEGDVRRLVQAFPDIKCPRGGCEDSEPGHILVRTPTKIERLLDKRLIDLSNLRYVVMDEADELLRNESSRKAVDKILTHVAKVESGIAFFSATFSSDSEKYMEDFKKKVGYKFSLKIIIPQRELKLNTITQFKRLCADGTKIDFLKLLIKNLEKCQVIVFVNTNKYAETIRELLKEESFRAEVIGGALDKKARTAILNDFRQQKFPILISTNLLARGFDERTIGLVINFDLPTIYLKDRSAGVKSPADLETYLHRVGRTGRFGDVGIAVNLYTEREDYLVKEIESAYAFEMKPLEGDDQKTLDKIENGLAEVVKINNTKRKELGEKRKSALTN